MYILYQLMLSTLILAFVLGKFWLSWLSKLKYTLWLSFYVFGLFMLKAGITHECSLREFIPAWKLPLKRDYLSVLCFSGWRWEVLNVAESFRMQFTSPKGRSIHLEVKAELPSWSWIYLSGLTERRKCLLLSSQRRIIVAVAIFGLSESLWLIKFSVTVRIVKWSETPSKPIDCFFLFLVHLKGAPEWWISFHLLLHCVMRVHFLIAKLRRHRLDNDKN